MSKSLSVENITVQFGGLKALDNVSLTFPSGQISGLIGPNGSGKSTLINAVTGVIKPVGGKVLLGERDFSGLRCDQIVIDGLARTFQIPLMPPQLTVQEIISVPFSYVKRRNLVLEGLDNAKSIADFCGLRAQFGRRCSDLSVTDLRRLEIARALACGPTVLLLDEAMAGLSHDDAKAVMEIMRMLHTAGMTIVVVEHVMPIISSLCSHVVVLNQGQLLAEGEPYQVLTQNSVREAYLGKGFKQ